MSELNPTPLLTPAMIAEQVDRLAFEIQRDFADRDDLILVGVLNGAFVFLADLIRRFQKPVFVDFLRATSYGESTDSTGVVRIIKDVEVNVMNRPVIIVEDIVDTGLTVDFLSRHLQSARPACLETCTLLDKPARRKIPCTPKYKGFTIDDHFVVGYGLDHGEKHRELPGIHVVSPP